MQDGNLNNNLCAVLGPTNTGKTFFAFDRMLAYKSGMYGFPLRLLARENYDRAVKMVGESSVALITGEEKIIPPKSRYFFCTVESMPLSKQLEFVAIDEVQLASDFERGHIFTDRILNIRGIYETILLGSLTIKKILKTLFPNINIIIKDRFSKLNFIKKQSINKLKPRTAIIAFTINDVYSIAEIIRINKGGAAVVLGALSPRTRNAQVEMYENQDVDFIVATDAIGMGLNLNINHVAFSSLKKFDGRINRKLNLAEIGQIAGRAGRFKNDGTFSCTGFASELDPISVEAIENHKFNLIKKIYWRNSQLDYNSVYGLLNSLNQNPKSEIFIKKKNAEDEKSFKSLSSDENIKKYLNSFENIKTLWEVCKIPDFQKLMTENYFEFLKSIYIYLMVNDNYLPDDWIKKNVERLNNTNGDIDTLSKRIAYIRTWTYISSHAEWIKNKKYWERITRKIEDKLSDELHSKLRNRFVDEQDNNLINKIIKRGNIKEVFKNDNIVEIQNNKFGSLSEFNEILSKYNKINSSNLALKAVKKSIFKMIPEKVKNLLEAPSEAFRFQNIVEIKMDTYINIYWGEESIGYLEKGVNIFSPKLNILNSELLDNNDREKIIKKLQIWTDTQIENLLKPININTNDISQSSNVRSIAYILFHNLGCAHKKEFPIQFEKLSDNEKRDLSKLGIRTGIEFFYFPNFLKKKAIELRAMLWKVYNSYSNVYEYPLPSDGRVYFPIKNLYKNLPETYWTAIGYKRIKDFAVRVDIVERVFFLARQKYRFGPFTQDPSLMNLIGCNSEQLTKILDFLGYESIEMEHDKMLFIQKPKITKKKINSHIKNKSRKTEANSAFSSLGSYFHK